jgi:hypothetical protein
MALKSIQPTLTALAFVAGALVGYTLSDGQVYAQQRFGPEDVRSVPPEFIEGGDRSYTVLKEINATLKRSEHALSAIQQNTARTAATLRSGEAPPAR